MRLWLVLLVASAVSGAPWDGCRELRHHGKLAEAKACFSKLLSERDPLTRAEALWGLGRHTDANLEFRAAEKSQANPAVVKTEWGNLFLERYQPGDAAKLYEEALEADAKYAPAYLGLARVAALGFDKKAIEFAKQGLERDPKLYEAHELLAYLALEDNDPRAASEEAHKALDISSNALQAAAVLASIDWLNGKNRYAMAGVWRRVCDRSAFLRDQPALRRSDRLLPESHCIRRRALGGALAAWRESDAARKGRRGKAGAGKLLQRRIPRCGNREFPPAARYFG